MRSALDAMPCGWRSEVKKPAKETMNQAVRFRTGLQICWLAVLPLRLANLTNVEAGTGKNLFEVDDVWWLLYSRDAMKGRREFDRQFPKELVPWLRDNEVIRQVLCRGVYVGDRLWISIRGAPQTAQSIRKNVQKFTKEKFGKPIAPHWFRDAVATAVARNDPANSSHASWMLTNDY
jgi:hypothetical protein